MLTTMGPLWFLFLPTSAFPTLLCSSLTCFTLPYPHPTFTSILSYLTTTHSVSILCFSPPCTSPLYSSSHYNVHYLPLPISHSFPVTNSLPLFSCPFASHPSCTSSCRFALLLPHFIFPRPTPPHCCISSRYTSVTLPPSLTYPACPRPIPSRFSLLHPFSASSHPIPPH